MEGLACAVEAGIAVGNPDFTGAQRITKIELLKY